MNDTISCPKCQSAMEAGFIIDRGDADRSTASRWAPGLPVVGSFLGFKTVHVTWNQTRAALHIVTFRCSTCGYLESYAPNAPVKT
ncbi:MAG: hypothetical protein WC718_15470 [Phycisphaerales bacterium]